MITDPIASMRYWAIGVQLGGQEHTIPALPAAGWWPVLTELSPGSFLDLIPGGALSEQLLTGAVGMDEIIETMTDAIEQVTGRPWQAAVAIVTVAVQHWASINGQLIREGIRWDEIPVAAALDAVHSLVLERLGDQKNEKTGLLLRDEYLAALEPRSADPERKVEDFEAIAGPRPTGGVRRPMTDTSEQPARSTVARSAGRPSRTPPPSRPLRRPGRSGAPIGQPATPARSEHPARSAPPAVAVPPASGTASRPHPR